MMRLNRFLSAAGVCSRREADRLIEAGRVLVDGHPAAVGEQVKEDAAVLVDGRHVTLPAAHMVFAYHKPAGVVCTDRDPHAERTLAAELAGRTEIPEGTLLKYIGRLDRESEGLLLLTDDGALKRALEAAESHVEKEYLVTTDTEVSPAGLEVLRQGVFLEELGITTAPCRIRKQDDCLYRVILTEGKNRQIRRMLATLQVRVIRLVRIREAGTELGEMAPGALRRLPEEEMKALYKEAGIS